MTEQTDSDELAKLDEAVDAFAVKMKARLRERAAAGYRGWDNPGIGNASGIEHVDVANLAMMLEGMEAGK